MLSSPPGISLYFLPTTSSSASLPIVRLENAALRPRTLEGRRLGLPDKRFALGLVGLPAVLCLFRFETIFETVPPVGARGPLVTLGPLTPPDAVREMALLGLSSLGEGLRGEEDLELIELVRLTCVRISAGIGEITSAGGLWPGAEVMTPDDGVSESSGGGSTNDGIGGDASSAGSGGGSLNDGRGGRSSSGSGAGSLNDGRGGRSACVGDETARRGGGASTIGSVSSRMGGGGGGGLLTVGIGGTAAGRGTGAFNSGDNIFCWVAYSWPAPPTEMRLRLCLISTRAVRLRTGMLRSDSRFLRAIVGGRIAS